MSDLAERLRATRLWRHSTPPSDELEESDLGQEAAAEIERLTAARDAAMRVHVEDGAEIERLTRENDALYDMLQGMKINLTKFLEGRKALEGKQ